MMPNTPAVVQAAASAFSVGSCCREGDAKLVKDLLSTVGYVVEVPENLMDPITGLSGSGPSYVSIRICTVLMRVFHFTDYLIAKKAVSERLIISS